MEDRLLPQERLLAALLASAAVLTFFFPVLTLQVPILGDQSHNGYEIISRPGEFDKNIKTASSELAKPKDGPAPPQTELPASIRAAWMVALLIVISLGFAMIALLATFSSGVRLTGVSALLGAVAGIAAIIHIGLINSDLHFQFELAMKMAAQAREAEPNPFMLGMVTNLVGKSFQLKPGTGLYVLTICLAGVAAITYGRVLVRFGVIKTGAGQTPAPVLH